MPSVLEAERPLVISFDGILRITNPYKTAAETMTERNFCRISLFLFLGLLVPYRTAYAYIDPGTGSYLIQVVMAGILGGLFAVKLLWRRVFHVARNLCFRFREDGGNRDPRQPD